MGTIAILLSGHNVCGILVERICEVRANKRKRGCVNERMVTEA